MIAGVVGCLSNARRAKPRMEEAVHEQQPDNAPRPEDSTLRRTDFGADMSDRLSLGVVMPTRNSAALLPRHVAGLRNWLDLADQVVVVDSFSTDGTLEALRRDIKHPNLEFLSHPPGLYQSWNFGIQRLTTDYAYIATVGDTITRKGLQLLAATARSLQCDAVISKPEFQDLKGQPVEIVWPIDDIIATLGIEVPRRLNRLEALVFACVHAAGALTGSCASDLFRTSVLKRFPFPTDFGTAGDGAWGLMHAAEISWGVVPGRFSTFVLHPPNASPTEKQTYVNARRADEVLSETVSAWRRAGVVTEEELALARWSELSTALTQFLNAKTQFDQCRKESFPWILKPKAWQTRIRRQHSLAKLRTIKGRALGSLPTALPH